MKLLNHYALSYLLIKGNKVWDKYIDIWYVIKDKLAIKFQSESVYEDGYLKAKVRELDGVIKTFCVMCQKKTSIILALLA